MRSLVYVPVAALAVGLVAALSYCAPTTTEGDPDAAVCDPVTGTNCPCDQATYKPADCYTGPKGTNGKGICKAGKRSCVNGIVTDCIGQVVPEAEVCNLADDDCNGKTDDVPELQAVPPIAFCNSPACDPKFTDAGIECFSSEKQGICGAGEKVCAASPSGGKPTGCQPFANIQPVPEECNGFDDDCNGEVEDGLTYGPCLLGGQQGICREGEEQCVAGAHKCVKVNSAQTEVCNGKDDDCDGEVDKAGLCTGGALCCRDFSAEFGTCTTFTSGWDECK